MSPSWADNLDMLAQNGVLEFDAPSYVTGQSPRYVGSIAYTPSPFVGPASSGQNLSQPKIDEFKPADKGGGGVKNPVWKKWLFGLITAGVLVFGGWKFKSKIIPWLKNLPKTLKFDKITDFFKNSWNKLFKKKSITP